MKSIYVTDKKYKYLAIFILIFGGLVWWASPELWPWVVGGWCVYALIAFLLRNNE